MFFGRSLLSLSASPSRLVFFNIIFNIVYSKRHSQTALLFRGSFPAIVGVVCCKAFACRISQGIGRDMTKWRDLPWLLNVWSKRNALALCYNLGCTVRSFKSQSPKACSFNDACLCNHSAALAATFSSRASSACSTMAKKPKRFMQEKPSSTRNVSVARCSISNPLRKFQSLFDQVEHGEEDCLEVTNPNEGVRESVWRTKTTPFCNRSNHSRRTSRPRVTQPRSA